MSYQWDVKVLQYIVRTPSEYVCVCLCMRTCVCVRAFVYVRVCVCAYLHVMHAQKYYPVARVSYTVARTLLEFCYYHCTKGFVGLKSTTK